MPILARRLTTILPAMRLDTALETTRIHRVAGLSGARTVLVKPRPCRAPHHTISDVGLIGGGHLPRPGEGSLAHHGVHFLDELPECRRHVLEACASRWRRMPYPYNLPHGIDLTALAVWLSSWYVCRPPRAHQSALETTRDFRLTGDALCSIDTPSRIRAVGAPESSSAHACPQSADRCPGGGTHALPALRL